MRTIRSFIAVNIGLNAVRAIAHEQAALRRKAAERGAEVRWVAPQNLHLTLRFLGQVTEPMVAAIQDGLEPVVRTISPIAVEAAGLGVFPDERNPRVVWVALREEGGALVRLHAAIAEVLGRMGFSAEDKPFRPHVTIGRVKGGDGAALVACLAEAEGRVFGPFDVREIVCYSSDLKPSGADYKMIWRLPLGGRARAPRPSEAERAVEQEGPEEPTFAEVADEIAEDAAGESETKEQG